MMLPPWLVAQMFGGNMPQGMMMGDMRQEPIPEMAVPPRVNIAMSLLQLMTQKQMDRPAMTDSTIQVVEGKDMNKEEEMAHAAACQLLIKYFDGRLSADAWEAIRQEGMKKKVAKMGVPDTGNLLVCISCGPHGVPNPTCMLCRGSGKILVVPVSTAAAPDINGEIVPSTDGPQPGRPHPEMDG